MWKDTVATIHDPSGSIISDGMILIQSPCPRTVIPAKISHNPCLGVQSHKENRPHDSKAYCSECSKDGCPVDGINEVWNYSKRRASTGMSLSEFSEEAMILQSEGFSYKSLVGGTTSDYMFYHSCSVPCYPERTMCGIAYGDCAIHVQS